MKTVVLLLILTSSALAQSPFDGTWVVDPPLPQEPIEYLLSGGTFHCAGCIINVEVKADGVDHKFRETDYWDTVNVQAVNSNAVEIIAKKAGKTMYTEIDAISMDGTTLTQLVKDTTEAETVTIETVARRVKEAPAGAHLISGSWSAFKTSRSGNASWIKYKCTPESFSGESPIGEKFEARFDGKFYAVEDDPGQTMVAARLIDANTVELMHKRKDRIVSVSRMTVDADGRTIHVVFENKDAGSTTTFAFHRQP